MSVLKIKKDDGTWVSIGSGIDATLTQEGQAADAKVVGDALAGKQPIGDYALKSEISTDYTESDPTVPAWAKTATKPTYTASEVGALPADTVIPTLTEHLASESMILSSLQYGDELPEAGTVGRLFFKKVTE